MYEKMAQKFKNKQIKKGSEATSCADKKLNIPQQSLSISLSHSTME